MAQIALMVKLLATLFIWIVIASVLVSYILSPYHPVRIALDRIVEPLLSPIRRILPATGMIDFSPLVLIVLIEFLSRVIISILTQ
ncbi:MAG TPA: YggT family protein [Anaerolineales bacterium]